MKQFAPLLFAASVAFSSQAAHAEDSGGYLGVGLADGFLSACSNATGTCNHFSGGSLEGLHARLIGGYDFNKFVGVEAGYADLGSYKVQTSALVTAGTVKASAFTLAAKGGYKFQSGFSVFGKLGLASVHTRYTADPGWILAMSPSQKSTGVIVGAAGQYDFTQTVGIRAGIDVITFNDVGYQGAFVATSVLAVFKL
jgi:hypothetical protein